METSHNKTNTKARKRQPTTRKLPPHFTDLLSWECSEKNANEMEDIERKLQDTLTTIAQSAENRGIRISANKTYYMHFCRLRKVHQEPKIELYGADIKLKPPGRILGSIFDRKLLWKDHITDLATKCKMRIF
ncbi:hypothetical protein JTB14_008423 [Gonioctena quinquepunctata]|nr:hypothetical protein JTB14_008423 [Gonioctena quinquepunctata]